MDECLLQICKTHVDLLGNPNSLSNILEWLDTVAGVFHKLDKHHRVVPNFDYIFRLKVKCYLMKIKHYFIFFFKYSSSVVKWNTQLQQCNMRPGKHKIFI